MALSVPVSSDPYYWLTSQLAARGAQKATCRLIAAVIIGFGTIPIVMVFSASQPQGVWLHGVAAVVSISCFAMGSQWLRPGWPGRAISQTCALAGTIFIAASSVLMADPLVGVIGITASAVLTFYVALFHSVRLLALTWLIYGTALSVLVARLAPVDIALAVGVFVLVALINVFAAFTCRVLLRLIRTDLPQGYLEPVTGLLTREGFYEQMATLLGARSRHDDRYLAVIVVNIDSMSVVASMRGARFANEARVTLGRCVRDTVRREALVAHPGDGEFFIADLLTDADPTPFSVRLGRAVTSASPGMTASVGAVTAPLGRFASLPPYDVVEELLTIASTAMFEARAAGGNQTRHAINPALTVCNEESTRDCDNLGNDDAGTAT